MSDIIAKQLLLGRKCENCESRKIKYTEQWDDRANTNMGSFVCVNFLRELHVTDQAMMALPYPEEGNGIEFDERGVCEYWTIR